MITLDGVPRFPGVFARTNDCCYALHKLILADVTHASLHVTHWTTRWRDIHYPIFLLVCSAATVSNAFVVIISDSTQMEVQAEL